MKTKSMAALASLFALALTATPSFADDNPTGLPDNPNTNENVIPGPNATNPTDPAAADSAAARVPTTEDEKRALHKNKIEREAMHKAKESAPSKEVVPPKY